MDGVQFSIGEALNLFVQEYDCRRDCLWSERAHVMDLQAKRISMINTVREEMRDQARLIISSVDNLMFADSVILLVAGQFAAEGTFPVKEVPHHGFFPIVMEPGARYPGLQEYLLDAYSVLLGLTLTFALGSLLVTMAIRLEAVACFEDITGDRGDLLPDIWERVEKALKQGVKGQCEVMMDDIEEWRADSSILRGLTEGVLQKARFYHKLYPVAQLLLWLGMLSGVALCGVMMGLIFWHKYPNIPLATVAYSGTVGLGFLCCSCFGIWMRRTLYQHRIFAARARARRLGADARTLEWRTYNDCSPPGSPRTALSGWGLRHKSAQNRGARGFHEGLRAPLLQQRPSEEDTVRVRRR